MQYFQYLTDRQAELRKKAKSLGEKIPVKKQEIQNQNEYRHVKITPLSSIRIKELTKTLTDYGVDISIALKASYQLAKGQSVTVQISMHYDGPLFTISMIKHNTHLIFL